MEILRPRARACAAGEETSSPPRKIRPEVRRAPGGSRPMSASALIVLPEPVSPTSAVTWPFRRASETPRTMGRHDPFAAISTTRSRALNVACAAEERCTGTSEVRMDGWPIILCLPATAPDNEHLACRVAAAMRAPAGRIHWTVDEPENTAVRLRSRVGVDGRTVCRSSGGVLARERRLSRRLHLLHCPGVAVLARRRPRVEPEFCWD